MIVQHEYKASFTDLELYLADGTDYLTAPEGYCFAGWSDNVTGAARYSAGDTVTVSEGSPLQLYAIWKPVEYQYTVSGCMAWVDPISKSITLEVEESWYNQRTPQTLIGALYDSSGKMLSCVVNSAGSFAQNSTITLRYSGTELPKVKVFALSSSTAPTGTNIEIDLPHMTPSGTR